MTRDFTQLNGLALAFLGDAIFETHVRRYLIDQGLTKPNRLHQQAVKFVSAKAQARIMKYWLEQEMLNEEELSIFKRGRNSSSHTSAKNADIITYRVATGFESVIGYLSLMNQEERLNYLMEQAIEYITNEIQILGT
ncbi:Mini-ribonuclease 3 [Atopobacter phocae]|uniref:Mini-ribonuclease 3 n=1 Tax=Atopobacter phocae TaxID=136492 RepID=UPI00047295DD|nr:Mini-ribonuclease 3 [Atopobacter phocae]